MFNMFGKLYLVRDLEWKDNYNDDGSTSCQWLLFLQPKQIPSKFGAPEL